MGEYEIHNSIRNEHNHLWLRTWLHNNWKSVGFTYFNNLGVSKNNGTPKSSILIGFSIIFTIHFGGPPLSFGNIHLDPLKIVKRKLVDRRGFETAGIRKYPDRTPRIQQRSQLNTHLRCKVPNIFFRIERPFLQVSVIFLKNIILDMAKTLICYESYLFFSHMPHPAKKQANPLVLLLLDHLMIPPQFHSNHLTHSRRFYRSSSSCILFNKKS